MNFREVLLDILPQNKWQMLGLVAYLLADSYLEYRLGKSTKIKASSKLEIIFMVGAAAVIAVAEFFKKGNDNGGKS